MSARQDKKIRKFLRGERERVERMILQQWEERKLPVIFWNPKPRWIPGFLFRWMKSVVAMELTVDAIEKPKQEEQPAAPSAPSI